MTLFAAYDPKGLDFTGGTSSHGSGIFNNSSREYPKSCSAAGFTYSRRLLLWI